MGVAQAKAGSCLPGASAPGGELAGIAQAVNRHDAAAAGLLSSAIPYGADLTALRYLPAQFFGTFSSVQPVCAALAGIVILDSGWPDTNGWVSRSSRAPMSLPPDAPPADQSGSRAAR